MEFQESEDFPKDNVEAQNAVEKSLALIMAKSAVLYNLAEIEEYVKTNEKVLNKKENNATQGNPTYFYQESNGSLLFVHPLNLEYMFMEHQEPPYEINVQLFDLEKYTQNRDVRYQFKVIGHIPNSIDFR